MALGIAEGEGRPRAHTVRPYKQKEVDDSTSFLFDLSPDQVVERNVIVIGKLYCRPERKLALSALISLVNGELHIQQFGDLLLCFIAILTQITYSRIHVLSVR